MADDHAAPLPPGARPIGTEELLACIGELYVQARVLRQVIAQQQQQSANGVLHDAVQPQQRLT